MGNGFYRIEVDTVESTEVMLKENMIGVRDAAARFLSWKLSFDLV